VAICFICETFLDFDTNSKIKTEIRFKQLSVESNYRYAVIFIAAPSIRQKRVLTGTDKLITNDRKYT